MILTGETKVLGEKLALVPICPHNIPHGLVWDQTLASVMRAGD